MSQAKYRIFVLYAGLLHSEWWTFPKLDDLGAEVYNGAFIYVSEHWKPHSIYEPVGWYRADKTPYPTEQVPAELRMLAILLT